MTSFEKDSTTFIYRVAAIILDGERVLLHQAEGEDFWSLPGGRVELMEDAADALRREMHEELGTEIQVGPLQFSVEAFLQNEKQRMHELGLYFLARLPEGSPLLAENGPFSGWEEFYREQPLRLTFQWFQRDMDHLGTIAIWPEGLTPMLAQMSDSIQNLILISS